MTNFEKWKQSLTVDSVANLFDETNKQVLDSACYICPVSAICEAVSKGELDMEYKSCKQMIMSWAYAEAEEGAVK